MNAPIWLTDAQVADLVALPEVMDALGDALAAQGRGEARSVPKGLAPLAGGGAAHGLGASWADAAGWKAWVQGPGGAASAYVLYDVERFRLRAVMQAGALDSLRTAAITGLAARVLARDPAPVLAVIGTGSQALPQVAAVALARPPREVRVHGRDPGRRAAFAESVRAHLPAARVTEATSVAAAAEGADIVVLVTRASEPILDAAMLSPDAMLAAVGAILPGSAEFAADVIDRAATIVADDPDAVLRGSREFRERAAADPALARRVLPISALLSGAVPAPTPGPRLFKALGLGLSDLAVARLVLRRAEAAGIGLPLPTSPRVAIRLGSPETVA